MSWQPPDGNTNATPAGWSPTTAPAERWFQNKRIMYPAVGLLVAVLAVIGALNREEEPPAPSLSGLLREQCPSFPACGIEATTGGLSLTFTLLPDATDDGVDALGIWARESGCLESVDFARMEQTRALDGMVESANGRSTWTYHPDAGLTIVCEP